MKHLKALFTVTSISLFSLSMANPVLIAQDAEKTPETIEQITQEKPSQLVPLGSPPAQTTREVDRIRKSIDYMVRRSKMVRTLAGQHLYFTIKNKNRPDVRLVADAAEVMAFDHICEASGMPPLVLKEIANNATSVISALLTSESTAAPRLTALAENQSLSQQSELVADVTSSILMFEIGRRSGLFEAILTDFGKKKFCTNLQSSLYGRFEAVQMALPEAAVRVEQKSSYIARRAQLVRILAAQHLAYLKANRELSDIRLIEDSSQVLAYDLICNTADMDPQKLGRIANDASYIIAKLAANESTLAARLGRMGQNQSVDGRLELLGDISATVLMYEIGRRRGLFDALLTDFGTKRFCMGMRADMRTRYNEMVSDLAE
ncbi:MAG: hypothetical protein COB37_04255 [Kordiimonadales bacterium]|nr:MAG: hypothetical protein COB37_04255 [Kordiimonadales bacterium]